MFDPWVGKIPWRRKWQPTPVFLTGKSHGQRNLAGYSPWGLEESDTAELLTHTHTHTHTHHVFFIHSSGGDGHLGCFHVLAIINNAALNIGVHVSFKIMAFYEYMPRTGIAGLCGKIIFSF